LLAGGVRYQLEWWHLAVEMQGISQPPFVLTRQ
jgi:hypothetical protein